LQAPRSLAPRLHGVVAETHLVEISRAQHRVLLSRRGAGYFIRHDPSIIYGNKDSELSGVFPFMKKSIPCAVMDPQNTKPSPLARIKPGNAAYPVIIGLVVVAWLFWRGFDRAVFDDLHFDWRSLFWLLIAVLLMAGRDIGYMARLRVLSDSQLGWRAALRVVMLWEFTSAITPSAVGGTSVATLYIHKEGLSVGRSSAIVMLTSLLDELYFLIMFPLLLMVAGPSGLFDLTDHGMLTTSLMGFALAGYTDKVIWVALLCYGLFVNPRGIKWLIIRIFRLRPLRRWYYGAARAGTDIIVASREIRRRKPMFWVRAGGATFLSWSSRYFVANALVMAFFAVSDHLMLFARQLVMWVVMLIMPTPGGSGFAEYVFSNYCSDLITVPTELQVGAAMLIVLLWRSVTYFPYLAIGAVIFPRWVRRHFGSARQS
jgi:uncharacterized membrane protein YbhN (UPF0104 family)